jgi:DNA-binding NarL/FixJ family response regulator
VLTVALAAATALPIDTPFALLALVPIYGIAAYRSWRAAAVAVAAVAAVVLTRGGRRERLRIARELHDAVGHDVSLMIVQAQAQAQAQALGATAGDEAVREATDAIAALGRRTMGRCTARCASCARRDRTTRSPALPRSMLSPAITRQLLDGVARRLPHACGATAGNTGALTDREREVMQLVAAGMSNAEIAQALVVAEPIVKTHVSNLLGKLGPARPRVGRDLRLRERARRAAPERVDRRRARSEAGAAGSEAGAARSEAGAAWSEAGAAGSEAGAAGSEAGAAWSEAGAAGSEAGAAGSREPALVGQSNPRLG